MRVNQLMHSQTATRTKPVRAIFEGYDVITSALREESQTEGLEFLERRPLHTVMLDGLIRDNGVVNTLNRGTFYGCRNEQGELEGVGLIGQATIIETSTDRA